MSNDSGIAVSAQSNGIERRRLWVPPRLWREAPHWAAFFPDFIVHPPGAPRSEDALVLGHGIASFTEGPWRAPAFNGTRRSVGIVVPGMPGPRHEPDARLNTAQATALPHSRFACPYRGRSANLAETLDTLALLHETETENRQIGAFLHMQAWKRDAIATAFGTESGHADFSESVPDALAHKGVMLAWAARLTRDEEAQAPARFWRVEDGFIRSIGLGVNFAPAASLALDPVGMHFDATRKSRLETILRETDFNPALLARASALRIAILRGNVTKYNLPGGSVHLPVGRDRQRILVVGQVEDDASVRFGAGRVRTNRDLLEAVRAAHPSAYIIWKPHPDVESGYRRGYVPASEAKRTADLVILSGNMSSLLGDVDALHTMTSLAGFEALIRGVSVTCWGLPFYAGWGLTRDIETCARRGRKLTLDELVAGSLILYPRYQDPVTHLPCSPELLLERLSEPTLWPPLSRGRRTWLVWWKLQGRLIRQLRHWRMIQR